MPRFGTSTTATARACIAGADGTTAGRYTLSLFVAGDATRDGQVDGFDTQAFTAALGSTIGGASYNAAADFNRDGHVDSTDRQLLVANYGYRANQAPVVNATTAKTHMDLEANVAVQTFLSDQEGDVTYYRLTGATHGSARLSGDGQSVIFSPEAGYTGPATFSLIADDGYSQSAEATVTVNISDARLVKIHIERIASLTKGTTQKLTLTGDFEDEKNVLLPASYLEFGSSDATVADVTATGRARGLTEGTAILTARSHGIQAVNALGVYPVQIPDPVYGYGEGSDEAIDPGVYPGTLTLVNNGGMRQLKITGPYGDDITQAATGTTYFVGNSAVASITPDGLVTGLASGVTTLSIINAAGQQNIELRVQAPSLGPTLISAADGGAVQAVDGSLVLVGPGALKTDATVSINTITEANLPKAVPSTVFSFAGAFQLDLGQGLANQPVQLAVPATAGLAEGTEVFFFRYITYTDAQGLEQPLWLLMDNGRVGADGVARTASPPYSGVLSSGTYLVATANAGTVALDILGGYDASTLITSPTDGYGLFVDGTTPASLPAAVGTLTLTVTRYGQDQIYQQDITVTVTDPSTVVVDLDSLLTPIPEPVRINRPFIQQGTLDMVDGRTATLTGGNYEAGDPRFFRDELFARFTALGLTEPEYRSVSAGGGTVTVTIPDGMVPGATEIEIVRRITTLSMNPDGSPSLRTREIASNGVRFEPQQGLTLVAQYNKISVISPGAAGLGLVKEISIPEGLFGFRTTPIAFSMDNSLGFVAGRNGHIHVIDMVSLTLFKTLDVGASTNAISWFTSLAVVGNDLYVAEGSRVGGPGGGYRLIRIDIDPTSTNFLKPDGQRQLHHDLLAQAPYGIAGMAASKDGRFLVLTTPRQPLGAAIYYQRKSGDVVIVDLQSVDPTGHIGDARTVAFTGDNRGKTPLYVEASTDRNKFTVSAANDYNRGFYTLELTRDAQDNLASAQIKHDTLGGTNEKPEDLRMGGLNNRQQLNIQRSYGMAVTDDRKLAFVADYNYRHLDPHPDPYLQNIQNQGLYAGLSPMPHTTIPMAPREPKWEIGGKVGIIHDPFGENPQLIGVTSPLMDGWVSNLELSADGTKLIASLFVADQSWGNGSPIYSPGLLVYDIQALLDTINASSATELNRQGIDTINPAAMPALYSQYGFTYGIGTQHDPADPNLMINANLGDVARIDLFNAPINDVRAKDSQGRDLVFAFNAPDTNKTTLGQWLTEGGYLGTDGGNLIKFLSAKPVSDFNVRWDAGSDAGSDKVGAILATDGNTVLGGEATQSASGFGNRAIYGAAETDVITLKPRAAGDERYNFTSKNGVFYAVPTLSEDQIDKLRRGEEFTHKQGGGDYFIDVEMLVEKTYADGRTEIVTETHRLNGKITVNIKDAQHGTFIGDRPLDNPGYSAFTLKGNVGTGSTNKLDVFKVEQRLKYLGFPAYGFGGENKIQDFKVDGEFGIKEKLAVRHFQNVISGPVDGVVSQTGFALNWLNAYNAPHWMEIFGTDPATGRGLPTNLPSIPGWESSQTGERPGAIERFGTSWLRDLMVAKNYASAAFGARTLTFNAGGDANGGFTNTLHPIHGIGRSLDLDINDYISRSRPLPNGNQKKDGTQFNAAAETVYNNATQQWEAWVVPSNPVGWSNQNAILQTALLIETSDYRQLVGGVSTRFGNNLQQSAMQNFLSLYSVTRNNGNEANGWDDLWQYVSSGTDRSKKEQVIKALFGDGTQSGSLISSVVIGGTGSQNPLTNMGRVLANLGINDTNPGTNYNRVDHQNHFHINLKRPTDQPITITQNLLADTDGFSATMSVSAGDSIAAVLPVDVSTDAGYYEEEIMLDIFVAALMSAADPTVVAQAPTAPAAAVSSSQSSAAGQPLNYEQVFAVCQDVKGQMANLALGGGVKYDEGFPFSSRAFSPFHEKLIERLGIIPGEVLSPERIAKLSLKVSELEAPNHGKVKAIDAATFYYSFIPDKDYLGKDRVVYLVEAQGKRYKVTINFWVVPVVSYPKGGEPYVPACLDQKFNGSSIDPAFLVGQASPATSDGAHSPGAGYAVTGYLVGALPFGDGRINVGFGDLSGSAVGQTTGNTITLDTDAAGHGWFLDTTPWDNVEYVATSNPNEWVALPGSEASGKMDLLTVLLHEYGHVLGLNHSADTHALMSEDLRPGVRHTVSVEDMQALWAYLSDRVSLDPNSPNAPFNPLPLSSSLLFGFTRLRREAGGQGMVLPPLSTDRNVFVATPAPTYSMSPQYERALHPDLYNGDFSILDTNLAQYGWDARGQASLELGAMVLREDDRAMSGLTQGFILPEGIQALRFTIKGAQFTANGNTPPDAFEAALLNMATGQSAVGTGSLSRTDSLFNLQSNGVAYSSSAVTVTGLPAPGTGLLDTVSPITVTVDLSNVAAGSVLKLYFDLLGMGAKGSSITIDDVRLLTSLATNTAPVAVDDAITTAEDAPLTFNMLANDQDAEGDTLAASIVQAPANGVLTANADGTYTYTPNANYFGTDTFIYTANDGDPSTGSGQGLDSNLATVSITITPVNDAPVAADVVASTAEDTGLTIDLVASAVDIDSATLSAQIVTGPANGVLTQNVDGSYTYMPNANFFGTDSFTYRVSDGEYDSNLATVSLTVTAANDAPLTADDAATTAEDTALVIDVRANDQDLDSSTLTTLLVAGPQHGGLAINADGSFSYTPDANFFGTDSFTYRLRDEELESNLATVNITVTPVNDAPVVADYSVLLGEDQPLTLNPLAGASDVDGDVLQVLPGTPAHGTLAQNADGTFIYTPDANFFGTDSLTFSVTDGSATVLATVTLNVQAVNDAPLAADIAASTLEDSTLDLDLRAFASDVDSTTLTPSIVAGPTHGTLTTNADGSFSYTANANFAGQDSFTYRVRDEELDSNVATVSITVASVNDAPRGLDATVTTPEDTVYVFQLADFGFSDPNDAVANNFLAVTIDSVPALGSLTLNGVAVTAGQSVAVAEIAAGLLRFAPAANEHGTGYAAFNFRVQDDGGTENGGVDRDPQAKTLTINITPVNDAPVAADTAVTTAEDTALILDLRTNVSDVDNAVAALTPQVVTGPQQGTLALNPDGTFTYTPNLDFYGTDSFTYRVNDGAPSTGSGQGLDSNLATVTITVTPVNDAPVAADAQASTVEDTALVLDLHNYVSDVDSSALTAQIVTGPAHGTLTQNADGTYTYTPNADFHGPDSFTYRFSDGSLDSNLATITLIVTPVNDAPLAADSAVTGTEDMPYVFQWADFHIADVDSADLAIVINALPLDGLLQYFNGLTWVPVTVGQVIAKADIDLGFLVFGPDANESGIDGYAIAGAGNLKDDYARFSYQATDGALLSAQATMTIDIVPAADLPSLALVSPPDEYGATSELVHTSWETAPNRNRNFTILPVATLEGWRVVKEVELDDSYHHDRDHDGDVDDNDRCGEGQEAFIIWSSGDRMQNANNQKVTVYAATNNGQNFLEIGDAMGEGHQTYGIERSVHTRLGATYDLNFDYAGRPGYSTEFTTLGVYVDGILIGTYANTSPNTSLNWQAVSFQFTGTGLSQTIRLVVEGTASEANGRGALLDDLRVTEQLALNTGYEASPIQLAAIAASLTDTDGSETLKLTIGAIPAGATLADGTNSFTATAAETTADITSWSLTTLRLTAPTGFTGTFDLQVTATASEAVTNDAASQTLPLTVTVLPANVTSPIVLDLNGDGIHTIALNATHGRFDLLNTGNAIRSGWLSGDDGFLALDENGNGIIDNRSELFGGNLGEGFAQLKALDSNRDGKLDANDSRFADLKVWRDANGNHQTDAGELFTLSDFDIISLNTGYTIKPEQQNGNWLLERSTATKADGSTMQMADAYFETPKPLREADHQQGATITVQSKPAAPKLPEFPWGPSPILINWPSRSTAYTSTPTPEPNKPLIQWTAWNASNNEDDDTSTKKDKRHRHAWLDDFLGVEDTENRDLAKATGLTVRIKAGEGKGKT